MSEEEAVALKSENARLIALLESHGIEWRAASIPVPGEHAAVRAESALSTDEKVALFRRLFRGRSDVYPLRWESKTSGKSGYAPACANEWRGGLCGKPQIKCSDCANRILLSLSDSVIFDHLSGKHTVGVYPLLQDGTCHFLAVDFDERDWREDARAFLRSCEALGVPAALEISRSGQGAHIWVFFDGAVPAHDARRLGCAIISHTCARTRQLKLTSYDRFFPNQDTMPKGGFGNLIALPLQKQSRERGCSVFADAQLRPYPDQWGFLSTIRPMTCADIEPAIFRATDGIHPLDVSFIEDEDLATPWTAQHGASNRLVGPMPASLTVTLANAIYFEKAQLPQSLANRLIRLAAFQNPEFYKAQAMRMSVWDKPRVIGTAQNYPHHIALPRGCLESALDLLRENGILYELRDERFGGCAIEARFLGTLRGDQDEAVRALLNHDVGVLSAPTAFGKTIVAAAMIARRNVATLVLVHRTQLLGQWHERLRAFLDLADAAVGRIGGGRKNAVGFVDVAVIQALSRRSEVDRLLDHYGHIIVDECHHVSAASFEAILNHAKAKYVLGLTATPVRRDGRHPIIFMQCGPIRFTAGGSASASQNLEVRARALPQDAKLPRDAAIQDVFSHLAHDPERLQAVVTATREAYSEGRKVLVLTERTDHLKAIHAGLNSQGCEALVLHGRLSKKQRGVVNAALKDLPPDAPRILLATGKLVGEGFDHPPLDTLILAMPISWKGTLQQYAGRLNREHQNKRDVRIIDFIDTGHPALLRMWDRRKRGYRAIGYRVGNDDTASGELLL